MGKILCKYVMHENKDGLEILQQYAREGDRSLIFVDPPYVGHEKDYRAHFKEHEKLAEILAEVPAAGVFTTYYDCDEVRQLYPESCWSWELFERWSTCTADGVRQRRDEVLLTRKQRVNVAIASPQIQKAIAPEQPTTQSHSNPHVKSRVESLAAKIFAAYQPSEIERLIVLLRDSLPVSSSMK